MPWEPIHESDSVRDRQIKEIAADLIAAKRMLDRHDPQQGPVWRLLDGAEAKLQGVASVLDER